MKVIGHRGAPFEALENSFSSFSKAISIGCQMIELDAWLALDGTMWVCHDNSLKRTAGRNLNISSSKKKDLENIRLSNGEALPSLDLCLKKLLPSINLNIELKDSSSEAAKALVNLLSSGYQKSKLVISSFHIEPLETIEKLDNSLQLALLSEENNSYKESPFIYLKDHEDWFFHPEAAKLDLETVSKLHETNTKIFPWASKIGPEDKDREEFWNKMKNFGVHGLCTNYPREFLNWLQTGPSQKE